MPLFNVSEYDQISIQEIEDYLSEEKGYPYRLSIYPDVIASGLIQIQCRPKKDSQDGLVNFLRPSKHIGLVPLAPEVSLWVNPKVPIANIDQMAKRYGGIVSKDINELRSYVSTDDTAMELRKQFALSLVRLADSIVGVGLLHEYVREESSNGSIAGNIDFSQTMKRYISRGIGYQVVSNSFKKSIDININRLIRTALFQIAENSRYESGLRAKADRISRCMSDVAGISSFHQLAIAMREIPLPSSRDDYAQAIPLSKVLLVDDGIDLLSRDGALLMEPLFVDMSEVFERYILRILQDSLVGFRVVSGNDAVNSVPLFEDRYNGLLENGYEVARNAFGTNKKHSACPDILIFRNATLKLVADVKYKPLQNSIAAKREDVEQVVTYAERFGKKIALSIHPCLTSQEAGLYYSGNVGEISVLCYQINLGSENLSIEEEKIASAIRSLII